MKKSVFLTIILSCIAIYSFSHTCGIQTEKASPGDNHLMRIFYVDATKGNDLNNGRSEAKAWSTLSRVRTQSYKPGDTVLLKREEVWREYLVLDKSLGQSGDAHHHRSLR